MPIKPHQKGKGGGAEYRFKIDAYTPETFPMGRLAEYMRELAQILGEPAQVHFARLAKGSTVLVHRIEREAVPKVRERVARVKSGDGPLDAVRAFDATNKLLRDDDAVGSLKVGAVVLQFPGRNSVKEEFTSVRQQGVVDGIVTSVRGRDQSIHILLQAEDKQISGCYTTSKTVGKQLAAKFLEPVRLFGKGKWKRDPEGKWDLIDFKIDNFEPLDDVALSAALNDLRSIPGEWGADAYNELETIRHGVKSGRNGGH